jgi:hypothetical protein
MMHGLDAIAAAPALSAELTSAERQAQLIKCAAIQSAGHEHERTGGGASVRVDQGIDDSVRRPCGTTKRYSRSADPQSEEISIGKASIAEELRCCRIALWCLVRFSLLSRRQHQHLRPFGRASLSLGSLEL